MEAIILAGGLGTRLRSAVADVPKSMALIQNRPFLEYQLDRLIAQGVKRVIFSVGYKSEHIENHFGQEYKGCEIDYAREMTQLGTGGAIRNAMPLVRPENVIVLNGDSVFLTDLQTQMKIHQETGAAVTFALKPMNDIERYGTVDLDSNDRVTRFNEKKALDFGFINAGSYVFNVRTFRAQEFPEKFSIEREFFETHVDTLHFQGFKSEGYFLDIGIPEDFQLAQYELGVFPEIDRSWTLFLDRDGVINRKRDNDYVKNPGELELLPGAIDAIVSFARFFGRIIVVTNQQGIGKGLMSEDDLAEIHGNISNEVIANGGRIDAFYHAPQLASENSPYRKPEIGMALKAQEDFPEIDFSKSVMIGDSPGDMKFAENAGMFAVFIGNRNSDNYSIPSLSDWNQLLVSILL